METIAQRAEREVNAKVLAIRSEGFGGDFRSGYEDAFRVIMELMEPPAEKMERAINVIGARQGPTYAEWTQDLDEIERMVYAIEARINGILCGGCTVEQI